MTKAELEAENKQLKEDLEELQLQYDNLDGFYAELEDKNAELYAELHGFTCSRTIYDVDEFLLRLDSDGLRTPELDSFIEQYLRYRNVQKV